KGKDQNKDHETEALAARQICCLTENQMSQTLLKSGGHLSQNTCRRTGGKSPAIVVSDYSIKDAARRIVHGKIALSGQICVAPDYALVEAGHIEAFTAAAIETYNTFYPHGAVGRPEVCGLINDRQKKRLTGMLEDARSKGASISPAADWDGGNQMPLHIVSGITDDMEIAQEEVFGPILPIVEYASLDDAIQYVNARPRPLALYAFTKSGKAKSQILSQTQSGGVTLNDWGWHVVNAAVPFGGVGNSGFGTYHGVEGFWELSNLRPVFERHPAFPTQLFYPPVNKGFNGLFQNIAMNFYSGKADRSLGGTPYGKTRIETPDT
ncbi:MAG: aldehyde dehydrogenase family protein, partial [Alphaproteobacteria bacterium]|nr:aldehyde dehydrogenase family protein [Alphaproteobacteria bacterium]